MSDPATRIAEFAIQKAINLAGVECDQVVIVPIRDKWDNQLEITALGVTTRFCFDLGITSVSINEIAMFFAKTSREAQKR